MSLVMIKTKEEIVQVASDYDGPAKTVYLEPKYVRASFKIASLKYSVFIKPKHWKILADRSYSCVSQVERVVKRYKVFRDIGYN